jgi:hypothetical protein
MATKQYDNYADLITFTRASTGTALRHVGYGAELVTNGTFDTDSDWTKGTGWTISGGAASKVTGVSSGLNQAISLTAGNVYAISYDLNRVAGSVRADFIGGTASQSVLRNSSGSYTEILVANTGNDTLSMVATSTFEGSVDNISVKEVIFDRATDPLVLFNHPTNVPRIEYDANGNRRGLLIEEARTNLLDYSEDFTNAYWTAINAATLAIDASGPDGETSAVTLVDSGEGGDAAEVFLFKNISVSTSTTYTFSVFAKADQLSWLQLALNGFTTPANNSGGFFDLANGSLGSSTGDTLDRSITDYGNGWYRCSITFTTDVADTAGQVRIYVAEGNGDRTVDFDGTSSILIYGAQVEAGSFPTSYISTAGAAASRSADVASIPTSAFGYNADKGTVVVDFETQFGTPIGFPRIWEIGNTSTSVNRVIGYIATSSSTVRCFVASNNVIEASLSVKTDPTPASGKLAFAFADDDFSCVIDGGSPVTETSGSFTTPSIPRNTLKIGGAGDSAGANISGHIKSIQYYPRRLTNTQLQELTA